MQRLQLHPQDWAKPLKQFVGSFGVSYPQATSPAQCHVEVKKEKDSLLSKWTPRHFYSCTIFTITLLKERGVAEVLDLLTSTTSSFLLPMLSYWWFNSQKKQPVPRPLVTSDLLPLMHTGESLSFCRWPVPCCTRGWCAGYKKWDMTVTCGAPVLLTTAYDTVLTAHILRASDKVVHDQRHLRSINLHGSHHLP